MLQLFGTVILTIQNTNFVENRIVAEERTDYISELVVLCKKGSKIQFSLMDSKILHTTPSDSVFYASNCHDVTVTNTQMTMANQCFAGFVCDHLNKLTIKSSCIEGCYNLSSVLLIKSQKFNHVTISNSTFFKQHKWSISVITFYSSKTLVVNSSISDNNMTGITAIESYVVFHGHNVIQNNRYTEGAGITLILPGVIAVHDELYFINNSAQHRGGAILVKPLPNYSTLYDHGNSFLPCSLVFHDRAMIFFSGNTAEEGGDNLYGATLIDCKVITYNTAMSHVGLANETSRYFYSPLIKYFQIASSSRLSSISSDPIMVCFCNSSSNSPDCSDRSPRHIQTYPGLEINTTIATVGYYGGTSTGAVQVSAHNAKIIHYYSQNSSIKCFQLHILIQSVTSTTASVDIKVKGGLFTGWGVSYLL